MQPDPPPSPWPVSRDDGPGKPLSPNEAPMVPRGTANRESGGDLGRSRGRLLGGFLVTAVLAGAAVAVYLLGFEYGSWWLMVAAGVLLGGAAGMLKRTLSVDLPRESREVHEHAA